MTNTQLIVYFVVTKYFVEKYIFLFSKHIMPLYKSIKKRKLRKTILKSMELPQQFRTSFTPRN